MTDLLQDLRFMTAMNARYATDFDLFDSISELLAGPLSKIRTYFRLLTFQLVLGDIFVIDSFIVYPGGHYESFRDISQANGLDNDYDGANVYETWL